MAVRLAFVLLLVAFLGGCRLFIVVPANGMVTTKSGAYNCPAGKTCDIAVVDLFFNQTFIAVPDDGLVFQGWRKADRSFCGGSRSDCQLSTARFGESELLLEFLARDDEVFYLSPVFINPDSPELIQLRLSGTWDYLQKWGDCSAIGRVEQFLDNGEVYQTYTPESQRVIGIEPCRYITANQVSSRTVGPIIRVAEEPLSVYEIEDAYRDRTGLEARVAVLSKSQYRVRIPRAGVMETHRYTRFVPDLPGLGL